MTSLPFLYSDFHGGLNTRQAPYLLEDTQARDINNIQGTTSGAITKRGGLVTFSTPAVTLTSLFAAEDLSPVVMIGAGGTALYKLSTVGAATSIGTGFTNNLRWEFVQGPVVSGQGPVFGMNGTDTPQQYNGTTLANWTATDSGGTLPNGKYAIYAQNQVFVAGATANPSRLYFSAIGDPTGWNPANNLGAGFLDFDPNDGQPITALGTVGPYVLVAKPRKLFVVTQPGNASVAAVVRRLSMNIGCVAHRSLAQDANGTYFLAEDRGVYVTNGSKITPISDLIQPTIDSLVGPRSQAVGVAYNAHYYLSVPLLTSTNDTTLDFDTALDSWWKHTFGSNQFAVFHPSASPNLYSAKATSALVDNCFMPGVYQDNGADFTWSWFGPWQSPSFYRRRRFPTPYMRKNLRQMRIDGTGVVDLSLAKDFGGGSGLLLRSDVFSQLTAGASTTFGGSGTFGGVDGTVFAPTSAQRGRVYSPGVANAFSVILSNTSNNPAEVFSYLLVITDRRDLLVA